MGAGKLKTILMVAPLGCPSCARAWRTLQGSGTCRSVGAAGARAVCAAGHCCAARARDLGMSVSAGWVTLGDIRAVGSPGDCPGLVLD